MGKIKKLLHLWFHPEKPEDWQEWLIDIIEARIMLPLQNIIFCLIVLVYIGIKYGFKYIFVSFLIASGLNLFWCAINMICAMINLCKH